MYSAISICANVTFPLQELRKKFEKSSDDVDSALSRYMSKKPKDPTLQEVEQFFKSVSGSITHFLMIIVCKGIG
jgi:hypothetical protein